MARIIGQAARYVSDEALKKQRQFVSWGLLGLCCLSLFGGIALGISFPVNRLNKITDLAFCVVSIAACAIGSRIVLDKLDGLERKRRAMRKGSDGELRVGQILADLPDNFWVVHGLNTSFGDLDHIVIGPTGVYILDSKNWRGVVAASRDGEILLNGNATDKPTIGPLVARVMGVRDKIRTLCGFEPPFFQVVLVFTSAWVDAGWGETGKALCVTDYKLAELIVENQKSRSLDGKQIDSIARAFQALASMDKQVSR